MTKTLEQLLKTKVRLRNQSEVTPDFRISVQSEKEGGMHILVHAFGHAGDALDFVVKENSLIPFRGVR